MSALSELSLPELGSQLAFFTALEKVVKERKGDVRFESERQLRNLNEATGADSIAIKIGDEKVGKLSLTSPGVGISNPDAFAKWAFETGMGHRRLVIDFDDSAFSDESILSELADFIHDKFGGNFARFEYEADDIAKKDLKATMGSVLSKTTGEIVPGAYVKAGYIRCTGCKPEDVGRAMSALGEGQTLGEFLLTEGRGEE